ncbi:MAG: hypothetical protein WCK27_04545 [Verrucomicrobiota bacterium]
MSRPATAEVMYELHPRSWEWVRAQHQQRGEKEGLLIHHCPLLPTHPPRIARQACFEHNTFELPDTVKTAEFNTSNSHYGTNGTNGTDGG